MPWAAAPIFWAFAFSPRARSINCLKSGRSYINGQITRQKPNIWDAWLLRECFNDVLATHDTKIDTAKLRERMQKYDEGVTALNDDWTYLKMLFKRDFGGMKA